MSFCHSKNHKALLFLPSLCLAFQTLVSVKEGLYENKILKIYSFSVVLDLISCGAMCMCVKLNQEQKKSEWKYS